MKLLHEEILIPMAVSIVISIFLLNPLESGSIALKNGA
jgi:hypothetical protein